MGGSRRFLLGLHGRGVSPPGVFRFAPRSIELREDPKGDLWQ